MDSKFDCPSCGAMISLKLKFAKVLVCSYCQSTLFIEDNAVRNAGKMSSMTDVPSILKVGGNFVYRSMNFMPIGRVRYDYKRGFWDEWFVVDDKTNYFWISVDEGDIAIEDLVSPKNDLPSFNQVSLNSEIKLHIDDFTIGTIVTEKNTCTCIGAEGELPFELVLNETYDYLDLSAPVSAIYTIEYTEDGTHLYKGKWIDPFDIKEV